MTSIRIGLISDTHGLLRPEALAALREVAQIWHAGDIGSLQVLEALQEAAPVRSVRGNNDTGPWAAVLPETVEEDVEGARLWMIHDLKSRKRPPPAGTQVVLSGHSHRPSVELIDGVLFVNPGSAGPRRFRLPITVGMLTIDAGLASAQIIDLGL